MRRVIAVLCSLIISSTTISAMPWHEALSTSQELRKSRSQEAYDSAATVIAQALESHKTDDSVRALLLHEAGNIRFFMRDMDSALGFLKEALTVWEQLDSTIWVSMSKTVSNIARVTSDEEEKLKYGEWALDLKRKTLDSTDISINYSLEVLGDLYYGRAEFARASEYYRRAEAIARVHVENRPDRLDHILLRQGNLHFLLGMYKDAIRFYEKSLMLKKHADSGSYGMVLRNVGYALTNLKQFDSAHTVLQESLRLVSLSRDFGECQIADLHNVLSMVYNQKYQLDRAMQHWILSDSLARVCGKWSLTDFALARYNKANIHKNRGEFDESRQSFLEADSMFRQAGESGWQYGMRLHNYAQLCRLEGRHQEALDSLAQAFKYQEQLTQAWLPTLPEAAAASYVGRVRTIAHQILTVLSEMPNRPTPSTVRLAATALLPLQGAVLDELTRRNLQSAIDTAGPAQAIADSLEVLRMAMSRLYKSGDGPQLVATTDSLNQIISRLELDLATAIGKFSVQSPSLGFDLDALLRKIPSGAALIHYFRFRVSDRLTDDSPGSRYAALILKSNSEPALVQLGWADPIDTAVGSLRSHLNALAGSGILPETADQKEFVQLATNLRQIIWDPIAEHLGDVDRLYIIPDGALLLVPIETLPTAQQRFLVEDFTISYLSAARDLLRSPATSHDRSSGLVAFADPEFSADTVKRATYAMATETGGGDAILIDWDTIAVRGTFSDCLEQHGDSLQPLLGTRAEVDGVIAAWESDGNDDYRNFVGPAASESNFTRFAGQARVVHVATHGYFVPMACVTENETNYYTDSGWVHPLLLSGLYLAGARADESAAAGDDGYLSGLEVSSLDLFGTDLVVLSACETGLGEVSAGEGIYGLRRAFQLAGAQTILSTLWKIPDRESARLLADFYRMDGPSYVDKLRKAQLKALNLWRQSDVPPHPFLWGGFVVTER